jgi:hypothetical protein
VQPLGSEQGYDYRPSSWTLPWLRGLLPKSDGPSHRYIGASSACWAIYSSLLNAGEPPLAPDPLNGLLVDAYAAQHPGTPSDQAVQSVAVHLLTLYGVLERGVASENALWVRQRALRGQAQSKRRRFAWLAPPSFAGSLTVADIVRETTEAARTEALKSYIRSVWSAWAQAYSETIADWYERFVIKDGL